jgi:uncharacterized protein (TIGR00661 family)
MTAYLANHYDLPLISLDNQHRIRYMDYPCPSDLRGDQLVSENIVRAIVPKPDVSLVTTFYFGNPKNDRTFIFPPIIRREVLETEPRAGDHILVYLTRGFGSLFQKLESFTRERFIVYGYPKSEVHGNLTYKPFSRDGFLEDLASCKSVMGTAGFTLMTESFHLRKPFLALPMRGQFEQELNGHWLSLLNYGKSLRRTTGEAIGDFLYRLPDFAECLKAYQISDNRAIKDKIDELLADDCALAREFHQKRRK